MKIVMTLLVRDEQDIIESNIEYHLSKGVDFFIATDNLSVDKTADILQQYEKKGLLHYIYESSDNYSQYKWVTRMARMAILDYHADWVINNDADEFWWPDKHDTIKDYLKTIPDEILSLDVPRFNFPVIRGEKNNSEAFYFTQNIRDCNSVNVRGHVLPSKCCHRGLAEIEVAQGNHYVSIHGKPIVSAKSKISIFHFPLRRYEQFKNKIRLGGAAYARNTELPTSIGHTWRDLYECYKKGTLTSEYQTLVPSETELKDGIASGRYVVDLRFQNWMLENCVE